MKKDELFPPGTRKVTYDLQIDIHKAVIEVAKHDNTTQGKAVGILLKLGIETLKIMKARGVNSIAELEGFSDE